MKAIMDSSKLQDAIVRGQQWLDQNKQTWEAETENGYSFKDNFAELLMLEVSGRWDYVDLRIPTRRWHYFGGMPVIVPPDYPDDNDTNAVAFSIMKPSEPRITELINEIAKCTNSEGIIQVHLNPERPRVAPEVSANILTLFYMYGRGDEVKSSLEFVLKTLEKNQYEPSRYYWMPEPLFYFCWRLLRVASGSVGAGEQISSIDEAVLPDELKPLKKSLAARVRDRIGVLDTVDALAPAIRLLICQTLDIPNDPDLNLLLAFQEKQGGFGNGWYVRYGSCGIKIGHAGFVACLAVEALAARLRSGQGTENLENGHKTTITDIS